MVEVIEDSIQYLEYKLHVGVFSSDYWLHAGLPRVEEVPILCRHILCRQPRVEECACQH